MMEPEIQENAGTLSGSGGPKRSRRSRLAMFGLAAGLVAVVGGGLVIASQDDPAAARSAVEGGRLPWDDSTAGDGGDEPGGRGSGPLRDGRGREMRERIAEHMRDRKGEMHDLERGPAARLPLLAAAADILGIEVDELADELRSGKSIAEVATERDVRVEDVIDALVAKVAQEATERITELVNRKPKTSETDTP